MPRVTCPGCEHVVKVADDATAVRCPECGRRISLREEDEDEGAERVREKPARKAKRGPSGGKVVEPEEGRVLRRSILKTFFQPGAGWILVVIGVVMLVGGVCASLAEYFGVDVARCRARDRSRHASIAAMTSSDTSKLA